MTISEHEVMNNLAPQEVVEVPDVFRPHIDAAALRFSYLFPDCRLVVDGNRRQIFVTCKEGAAEAARQLRYLLYREKMLADAAPLRRKIYDRLFGR